MSASAPASSRSSRTDKLDNKLELAYAGWPDRLYLIGVDGRVAYESAPGPAGFIPSELEAAITRALKR